MSSARREGDGAAGRRYYCHQCSVTVFVPGAELSCPQCHGDFLEAVNLPNPVASFDALLSGMAFANPNPNPDAALPPPRLSPVAQFLQNYLHAMMGEDVGFELPPGGGPIAGVALGDYFFGPGMDQLIDRLAENDPNRLGTPPAARSAVDSLPDIKVSGAVIAADADSADCSVCREDFKRGEDAKQMPCGHIYHAGCILPWLELHNSCPICRHELPTEDPDYEQQRVKRRPPVPAGGAAQASAAAGDGSDEATVMEQRFTESVSFDAPDSQAEGGYVGCGGPPDSMGSG